MDHSEVMNLGRPPFKAANLQEEAHSHETNPCHRGHRRSVPPGIVPAGVRSRESGPRERLPRLGVGTHERLAVRRGRARLQLLTLALTFGLGWGAAGAPPERQVVPLDIVGTLEPSAITWSADLGAWLLPTRQGVYTVQPGQSNAVLLVPAAQLGFSPQEIQSLAVSPASLLVYRMGRDSYAEYSRPGFRLLREKSASDVGVSAFGGLEWLGDSWVVVGRPHPASGRKAQIQRLAPGTLAFRSGIELRADEQWVLRGLLEYGFVAVSRGRDRALLGFQGLRRVTVLSKNGAEVERSAPIPPGRALEDNFAGRSPGSPEEYATIYRGKRVVVGGGWQDDVNFLVVADPGGGPDVIRVYSSVAGRPFALLTALPVASSDPRDAFLASVSSAPGGHPEMLLLIARYAGGSRADSRQVIRLPLPDASKK